MGIIHHPTQSLLGLNTTNHITSHHSQNNTTEYIGLQVLSEFDDSFIPPRRRKRLGNNALSIAHPLKSKSPVATRRPQPDNARTNIIIPPIPAKTTTEPGSTYLDDGELGGGDVESIDIWGQASEGLLGSIRAAYRVSFNPYSGD
jgi:hypothetical protein